MFSRFFSHHYYLPPEYFHQFNKKSKPIRSHSLSLLTPALATTNLYSDSLKFLILSLAYKQNHAMCVVFFLLSDVFSSVEYCQGSSILFMCQNQNSVSLKSTIIFHCMDIAHYIDPLFNWINVGLFLLFICHG